MSDILPPRTTHGSNAKLPPGWYWATDVCDLDGYRDELQDAEGYCLAIVWWEPDGWRWQWHGEQPTERQRPSSLGGARRKAADAAIARAKQE